MIGSTTDSQDVFSFKILNSATETKESTKHVNIIISSLSRLLGFIRRGIIDTTDVDLVIVDDFEYSKSLNSLQDFKYFFSRFNNARAIVSTEGDKKIIPPVLNNPAILCSIPFSNESYYNYINFVGNH
ncbi:predicted protein [Naegleria gruberi]|uniref:Predicted protein n=1 Tax=Naegleria gruberi TaxID=5762 RepID=D2VGZ8_NAEGR|nr:uncharacterized protein NAEGRDRAFT_68225 [Naegleria gruberi]EFC43803.1 predicted protein [Naegleria gruberi]|eukprot:XP_002676547.1 predicted protein [Naegleria gruberi strain NEG-M]